MRMESHRDRNDVTTTYVITVDIDDEFRSLTKAERKRMRELNTNKLSHALESLLIVARAGERESDTTIGKDGRVRFKKKKSKKLLTH